MFTRADARERVDVSEARSHSEEAEKERARERAREIHEQQLRDIGWHK